MKKVPLLDKAVATPGSGGDSASSARDKRNPKAVKYHWEKQDEKQYELGMTTGEC